MDLRVPRESLPSCNLRFGDISSTYFRHLGLASPSIDCRSGLATEAAVCRKSTQDAKTLEPEDLKF